MLFKRDEAFRYSFAEPLPVHFQIVMVDDHAVTSTEGDAIMLDLSLEGAKLSTELDLHKRDHEFIRLGLFFTLYGKNFDLLGDVVWEKHLGRQKQYGIHLLVDDEEKQRLLIALKQFVKDL